MLGLHGHMCKKISIGLFGCFSLFSNAAVYAATVPWVGTADYTAAPGASGDEDTVVNFSSYDFSNGGVVLIKPNVVATNGQYNVGDTFTGYYQTYVANHTLSGVTVASPNLNTTGSGSGYELTLAAVFTEQVVSVDALGNATFAITGGNANLYFDTNPDYSFVSDSGFTNGTSILNGSITGGSGSFISNAGIGVTAINLNIGNLGYDHNIYTPNTISGGDGIFTLQINPTGVTSTVSSVNGQTVALGDTLLQADGNLNLSTVPIPTAIWLLSPAVIGILVLTRRKHNEMDAIV